MKGYLDVLILSICFVLVLLAVPFLVAGDWLKKKVWK